MERAGWLRYLWPGLPQLAQGNWWGLGWAVVGAALLNGAVLTTFLWKEWVPEWAKPALWGGIVLLWSGAALASASWDRLLPAPANPPPASSDGLFLEAMEFYLQGQWFEAEKRLIQLLRQNPRDVEARLMIATLFRHTRRWQEALRQLDQLERVEASRAWALEIARERLLIQQAMGQSADKESPDNLTGDKISPPVGGGVYQQEAA